MQNIVLHDAFSLEDVSKIISIDANSVSTNVKRYKADNTDKYYVLLNTWFYMCSEYIPPRGCQTFRNLIMRNGLISVINDCSELASSIIRSDFTLEDLGFYGFMMNEDPRITLQLLRYPKRFSPSSADVIRKKGLVDFLSINRRCKGKPSVIGRAGLVLKRKIDFPRFILKRVRFYCHEMLHTQPTADDVAVNGRFSTGATADGCRTPFEKYRAFSKINPCFLSPLYPLGFGGGQDIDYVKVIAVPKSYKTPRIIAEVSTVTQFYMQGIRQLAEKSLASSPFADLIILNDQTINQEWAHLGSIYGEYCTVDLSAASDSISQSLAEQVLPSVWFDIIDQFNPDHLLMPDGSKVVRNIFLTSGSGDTFVIESVIFLAIALTATEYAQVFFTDELKKPRVFGDDIICDTRASDTLCDFLNLLCFTVNTDKTFASGRYRESCGAEYFCGLDTATKYYPRRAFDESSAEYIQGLVSLQHRLYEFESCEQWLSNHIRSLTTEKFTSSPIGSDVSDLWADYPFNYTVMPPYDHSKNDEWIKKHTEVRRERHMALVHHEPRTSAELDRRFRDRYNRPLIPDDIALCELFRYVDFLRFGVPLDEFGYPIHRAPVSQDLLLPEMTWGQITV